MNISLHLAYEGKGGRPLTVAKISDRALTTQVAKYAIAEAFDRAEMMRCVDDFVGEVQREEAERLKKVLELMIPEIKSDETSPSNRRSARPRNAGLGAS